MRTLERTLIAWAVGSLVGVLAFLGEAIVGPVVATRGGLAAYALAGGAIASLSRSILAPLVSAPAARAGALGSIAAFGSLHALHSLNVNILPGQHYLAWNSLLLDALVAAPFPMTAGLLSRARWAQGVRERWGHVGAVLGGAALSFSTLLALAAIPRPAPEPQRRGDGPNLLLIVLDSARADRLAVEGTNLATPALSRLAQQGRRYSSAWAASSWTVPSVTTILGAAPAGSTGLPARLAARGYRTACFTDNPHLAADRPPLRDFDRVERSVGGWRSLLSGTTLGEVVERLRPGSDAALVSKAVSWMQGRSRPFFLYAHLMDSHTPYRFPPLDGQKRRGRRVEFPMSGMQLTQEEEEGVRARYDGGVHSADAAAARLVASVVAQGRPFVAVITADHGESLGEDGRWFHGRGLPREVLAIPLVVVGEGVEPAVVHEPVGHAAVTPTLLASAGIACSECGGLDLRRDRGRGSAEGGLPPHMAYRVGGGYRLVLDLESGQRTLFALRADPQERHDLATIAQDTAAALAAGLTGGSNPAVPSWEIRERLRALGYTGS